MSHLFLSHVPVHCEVRFIRSSTTRRELCQDEVVGLAGERAEGLGRRELVAAVQAGRGDFESISVIARRVLYRACLIRIHQPHIIFIITDRGSETDYLAHGELAGVSWES